MPPTLFVPRVVRCNDGRCLQMSCKRNFPQDLKESARERRQPAALRDYTRGWSGQSEQYTCQIWKAYQLAPLRHSAAVQIELAKACAPRRSVAAERKTKAAREGAPARFTCVSKTQKPARLTTHIQVPELSAERIENVIAVCSHKALQARLIAAVRRRAQ